jgi:hypothetical protein
MLADLFERVRATATGGRDPEAEAFIAEAVRAQPYAPYVLAQTTLVQQHALEAAAQRIADLEARAAAPQQETSFLGNLGKTLFGGAAPAPAPRANYDASAYRGAGGADPSGYRQPAYAPPPPAGPWGAPPAPPAGGGFLANAMTTAAGVAGGMMLANTLESLVGGRGGLFGGHSMGGFGGGETINNFYESAPDPAGQHAEDVLQDMDQDQDDAQDAGWDDGGSDAGGFDS